MYLRPPLPAPYPLSHHAAPVSPCLPQIVPASYAAAAYLESVNFKATGKKVLLLANNGVEEVRSARGQWWAGCGALAPRARWHSWGECCWGPPEGQSPFQQALAVVPSPALQLKPNPVLPYRSSWSTASPTLVARTGWPPGWTPLVGERGRVCVCVWGGEGGLASSPGTSLGTIAGLEWCV